MPAILIADDENDFGYMVKMVLKMQHPEYEVEVANSKEELLKKMGELVPDLILLDVWLGPEDGREICKFLKNNFKDIIIMLSSASSSYLAAYKECMADDYLEKPFEITEVVKKIENLLQPSFQK